MKPLRFPARIAVGSYNVHGCLGRDGLTDSRRTLRVIEGLGAPVVGLQEVDIAPEASPARPSLLEHAAEAGFTTVPGRTLQRGEGEFGNALLTRLPVVRTTLHDISVDGREPRGVIDSELALRPDLTLRVVVAHFGLRRSERRHQANVVLRALEQPSAARLTVLLADLNEWLPGARTLAPLGRWFGRQGRRAPCTFPARTPLLALDRIWVRPAAQVADLRAVCEGEARVASDHLPLVAALAASPAVPQAPH